MIMIKLILFDLGGVIVDLPNKKYYEYLSKVSGISPTEIKIRIKEDSIPIERGEISLKRFIDDVAKDLGIKKNQVMWLENFKERGVLNKDVAAIVRRLKKNYNIAFISNIDRERYRYGTEHQFKSLLPLFDYRFASYKLKELKPSPLIYKKVLRITRLKSKEILFIDNDVHNVYGARKVGIKSIKFHSASVLKKDLKRFGVRF